MMSGGLSSELKAMAGVIMTFLGAGVTVGTASVASTQLPQGVLIALGLIAFGCILTCVFVVLVGIERRAQDKLLGVENVTHLQQELSKYKQKCAKLESDRNAWRKKANADQENIES